MLVREREGSGADVVEGPVEPSSPCPGLTRALGATSAAAEAGEDEDEATAGSFSIGPRGGVDGVDRSWITSESRRAATAAEEEAFFCGGTTWRGAVEVVVVVVIWVGVGACLAAGDGLELASGRATGEEESAADGEVVFELAFVSATVGDPDVVVDIDEDVGACAAGSAV